MKLDRVCRVGKGARAPVVRVTCKLDCAPLPTRSVANGGHGAQSAPLPTLRFTSNGTRCNPSGSRGSAAALAEAREKLSLAGLGFFHVARLDVTEAAHLFGQARDLDRERVVVVVEPHRDLAQDLLVVRNQQPLL